MSGATSMLGLLPVFVAGVTVGVGAMWSIAYATESRCQSHSPATDTNKAEADDFDSDDEEDAATLESEPLKLVMIVRTDLKMGKGKIAAQCCHAAVGAYRRAPKADLQKWYQRGAAKIALKCSSQEDLLALEEKADALGLTNYVVCDAGRTQIAAGSMTVLAVGPAPASVVDRVAGHLKLM